MKLTYFFTIRLIWAALVTVLVFGGSGCRNDKEDVIQDAADLQIPVGVYDAFVAKYSREQARQAAWTRVGNSIWEGRFIQGNDDISELITEKGAFLQDSGRLIRGTDMPQQAYQYLNTAYQGYSVRQVYIGDTAQSGTGYRVLLVYNDNSRVKVVRFNSAGEFIREDIIG
ncbi:hypothetical protein GCM10023189_59720 [Nibrella saemangeumensis]|uniref:Beta-lactamase-inhibitor-like PepSY-like domain-containing protein n=1 Tax=Nibrella saemangeumensis TaxID=1084526 RepID=A0ABP8NSM4_9BACT